MTKENTLQITVDEAVKDNAEATLKMLGLSISEAVNMFLCQVSLVGGMPFDVKLPAPGSVIVRNEDELIERLEEGERCISEGRVHPANELFEKLESEYGV